MEFCLILMNSIEYWHNILSKHEWPNSDSVINEHLLEMKCIFNAADLL